RTPRGVPMATADYYRKQAQACLHMSRVCPDPVLAEQLGLLAAEFMEAAADQDDVSARVEHHARGHRRGPGAAPPRPPPRCGWVADAVFLAAAFRVVRLRTARP